MNGPTTERFVKDFAFEVYFHCMLRARGYDFVQHAALLGAIPSLRRTVAFHSAAATDAITQLGFSVERFAGLLCWLRRHGVAARTPLCVPSDETSVLAWIDISGSVGELVGLVVSDADMRATSLRLPDTFAALRAIVTAANARATKLFVLLISPLAVHRLSYVLAVFGANDVHTTSAAMRERLSTIQTLIPLATAGAHSLVSYAHDCASGELGATNRMRAEVRSAALTALSLSSAASSTFIRAELPRPALTAGKGELATSRAALTPERAAEVRRLHPTLSLAWPVSLSPPLPFLDFVHVGKCAFTYLRTTTHVLRIGDGIASTTCVLDLMQPLGDSAEKIFGVRRADLLPPRARSGAADTTERPSDPMRWPPVERFCSDSVHHQLQAAIRTAAGQQLSNLRATALFRQYLEFSVLSMLDPALTMRQRIYRLGWAYYFLFAWRQFVQSTAGLNLVVNFVHSSQFAAVCTNLHSLIVLSLFWAQHCPDFPLPTWLLGSQACEHLFRALRELHDTPLFSPLQMLQRLSAIGVHQEIRARRRDDFNYPDRVRSSRFDELVRSEFGVFVHSDFFFVALSLP